MDSLIFHGYCYGTAIWYALRGACRVYDPEMVIGWFRPPIQSHFVPNDLERYTIKTDAWGLISLALLLVTLSIYASQTSAGFRRAAVLVTVMHHVTTGIGAWDHYKMDSHFNTSMGIGVWANVWLTLVGLAATAVMPGTREGRTLDKKVR
ncbi:hypothetical protein AAFC00_006819 [Neodothiora populina]|uniref:Uncharacterized protein n=1 Tax=Neodothiora populina TaxID=2781224 RepID=A0ABR3PBE3_9PEZI